MQGFVYKQSYKAIRLQNTKKLNSAHLVYIASRPGTQYNSGCNFGLFGKIPGMNEIGNIDNLERAKYLIREASNAHTIYRSILSLDHETAMAKGYYKRQAWEDFLKSNIYTISKNMNIESYDFCFVASMHFKKGHPHTHIMFWDKSNHVRQEHIPKERFEIMTERIRADFDRELFRDEILKLHSDKRELEQKARMEVQAIFKSCNDEEILAIERVKADVLNEPLERLLSKLCFDKQRRYAYLKPDTKSELDSFIDKLFELPQFKSLRKEYLNAAVQVSEYYGNGESSKEYHLNKAGEQFKKSVANSLLKQIKENDLVYGYIAHLAPTHRQLMLKIGEVLSEAGEAVSYQALKDFLPQLRTPMKQWATKDFYSKLHSLTLSLMGNENLDKAIHLYISNQVRIKKENPFTQGELDFLKNSDATELKNEYGKIYNAVKFMVIDKLYDDCGYIDQWKNTVLSNMLITVFAEIGREKNYIQSQVRNFMQHTELSKTALNDLREQLKNAQHGHEM